MRLTRISAPVRAAALALAAGTVVSGCAAMTGTGEPLATIVVSTNILGDVAENIVGDQADVVVLMEAGSDPHSFGISARQAAEMESAELIITNGLGLEEGVLRHVDAAADQGVPVLEVAGTLDPLPFTATDSPGGIPDPHFWTDPQRMAGAVNLIADAVIHNVASADPAAVRAQSDAYRAEVEELDAWMETEFAAIPAQQRSIVTNHHVFGYLASRFGFTVTGAIIPGGSTLASPSSSDLDDLAAKIRTAAVPAIFADSSQPDRLARVLADEAGLDVAVVGLFTESLGTDGSGAETYVQMMRTNTERIVAALTGGVPALP